VRAGLFLRGVGGAHRRALLRRFPTNPSMERLNQIKAHLSHKSPNMKHKVAVIGSGNWYSLLLTYSPCALLAFPAFCLGTSPSSCATDVLFLGRGTAVAKIAAENISEHSDLFEPVLNLWVFEETVNGEKLSNIINAKKENVKFVSSAEDPQLIHGVGTSQESNYPTTSMPSPT
jgi:hypothetical protein